MKRLVLLILILLFCVPEGFSKGRSNDLGQWDVVSLDMPVTEKVKANLDIQARLNHKVTNIDMVIVRPSVGYQLTPHISIWQGYGWMPRFRDGVQNEHRIWQQVLFEHKYKDVDISNRVRLEERLLEGIGGPSVRGRHLLRVSKPFGQKKRWYVVASNEFFVNLNSKYQGPQSGFDQNRSFVGVGRKLNKQLSLETGYQLQYINERQKPNALNHIGLVSLKIKL